MLSDDVYARIDAVLAPTDTQLRRDYPGERTTRQPVHVVYVPADRFAAGLVSAYSVYALGAVDQHGPLPFDDDVAARVRHKLATEPIEDLRVDFEDGYGHRRDEEEDAAARSAGELLREDAPVWFGLRCKSLEAATRRRAIRTLDVFLEALGPPPPNFVITVPKVSAVEQAQAMSILCGQLELAHGLAEGQLRFELQIETPPAVLGADGTVTLARMIHETAGRCVGLHYGTYDYSAAVGIAGRYQSLEHPAADFAKAVMQVAAAGTSVRLSDGSTNVLPVGDTPSVRAAWELHARLVRRGLERGFYQGWDLHPAQLPTRFGATFAFYREAAPQTCERLAAYFDRSMAGTLDEPATARALARFLLRGLDCGALDPSDVPFERSILDSQ
jgi:citrate lyase beta subunit